MNNFGRDLQHRLSEALIYGVDKNAKAFDHARGDTSSGSSLSGSSSSINGNSGSASGGDDKKGPIVRNRNPAHAVFVDSCAHHTKSCYGSASTPAGGFNAWRGDITSPSSAATRVDPTRSGTPSKKQVNPDEALAGWLADTRGISMGITSVGSLLYVQEGDFPCLECCRCTFGQQRTA